MLLYVQFSGRRKDGSFTPLLYLRVFIIIIFIVFTFFEEWTFRGVHIIRTQYNKLQFAIRISSIEVSRQNYASLRLLCIQQNVSGAEELPETSVKGWRV